MTIPLLIRHGMVMPVIMALCLFAVAPAHAVPEVISPQVADVTPSSFSLFWMTNVYAEPEVQVFTDKSGKMPITAALSVHAFSTVDDSVTDAARNKRILGVSVSGVSASSVYYVRAIVRDPAYPLSFGQSRLIEVRTPVMVTPSAGAAAFSNDLAKFKVYVRPKDGNGLSRIGDVVIINAAGAAYPVSALVGDGVEAPFALLDLNNLFSVDGASLDLTGDETLVLTVYRGGSLSQMRHYRLTTNDQNMVEVMEPARGFFADIDIDGDVDDSDFRTFKEHFRSKADDDRFNPDYDFVEGDGGAVDAMDFSKFSVHYGRTDVR